MAWQDYLNIVQEGLQANLPTTPDLPSIPRTYYCTDSKQTFYWVPTTPTSQENNPIPSPFSNPPVGGAWSQTPATQVIVAAGQTIAAATLITTQLAIVKSFSTATHNGVRLPVAVTGLEVEVVSGVSGAGGFKVYPGAGARISTAAISAADSTTLKGMKSNTYIAISATHWSVQRGT